MFQITTTGMQEEDALQETWAKVISSSTEHNERESSGKYMKRRAEHVIKYCTISCINKMIKKTVFLHEEVVEWGCTSIHS